jgi:hypothetical protein
MANGTAGSLRLNQDISSSFKIMRKTGCEEVEDDQ